MIDIASGVRLAWGVRIAMQNVRFGPANRCPKGSRGPVHPNQLVTGLADIFADCLAEFEIGERTSGLRDSYRSEPTVSIAPRR